MAVITFGSAYGREVKTAASSTKIVTYGPMDLKAHVSMAGIPVNQTVLGLEGTQHADKLHFSILKAMVSRALRMIAGPM